MALLEVCVDDAQGVLACVEGGVDRIELCSALALGGLTPGIGLMRLAVQTNIPVFAMIRPRAGDFCFSDNELSIMCDDIAAALDAGVQGVVLGAATQRQELDFKMLGKLTDAAGDLEKTLHRVIDTLHQPLKALEQTIDLGFDYVLSSGGQPRVAQGVELLAKLNAEAQGRIRIMAGAGLTPSLVASIHRQTGIDMFHASCRQAKSLAEPYRSLGFAGPALAETDATLISQYTEALALLS
ncbi:MAG: copper homeostasis protein CutC [Granulosicoccus sp.]